MLKKISLIVAIAIVGLEAGRMIRSKSIQIPKPNLSQIFNKMTVNKAYADPTPTGISTLRSQIFLIIGYPSTAVYNELNPSGGPPQDGLLGIMNSMFQGLASIASVNGVTTCESIPSTGSVTGSMTILTNTVSGTLTYGTPSKAVPTGWTNAGTTYSKKVSFNSDSYDLSVEFFCDRDSAYASMSVPGDTISGSTRILNLYYDTTDADALKVEFGMKVTHSSACDSGNVCDSQLMRVQTGASNQFHLWNSSFAYRTNKYQAERMQINGNYSTHEMTSYYTFESDSFTNYADITGANESATASADFDFSQPTTADMTVRGCIDYDSPTTALTANTDCSSYSLSDPTATFFSAGSFSYTGLKALHAVITAP
jgi:hypothetical protein